MPTPPSPEPTPPTIAREAERSATVRGALAMARQAHAGQTRKVGREEVPFIDHPLAVAERLAEEGLGEEVLAAGLLHDVLEETELGAAAIAERIGPEVARLVEALTEDASIEAYEARKDEQRRRAAAAGPDAIAIFAADKAVNVDALCDAYGREGEEVVAGLPVSLETKLRVWTADLEMLFAEPSNRALSMRLTAALLALWAARFAQLQASFLSPPP